MMMMTMMLTNVFTRCDTACPAQPGLEPLATVGRNWIIKIIIITITKDDSDEDDDGNGEVDGWYPAQVSSPTLPICDRLPIPPLSLSPCTYILSLWWSCCHDDDDGDNNDDATTCMQAWQRQLFPVKVTRSPVGKGRLHRAHVKQAWGETYFLSNSKDKSQCRELSPGEKYFQERWPPLLRQRGCISRTLSQNLSEMLWLSLWWLQWWFW